MVHTYRDPYLYLNKGIWHNPGEPCNVCHKPVEEFDENPTLTVCRPCHMLYSKKQNAGKAGRDSRGGAGV